MSDKVEVDTTEPEFITEHIGEKLRGAREAKSMSIEEIARRLNLEAQVVDGLESNNYQDLPEPAYVRGYLLSYIRLMELPESLLKSFDEANPMNVPLLPGNRPARSACSDDGWVKCISGGLVVILVIVVVLWVLEQSFHFLDFQEVADSPAESVEPVMQPVASEPEPVSPLKMDAQLTGSTTTADDMADPAAATTESIETLVETVTEEPAGVVAEIVPAGPEQAVIDEAPPADIPVMSMRFSDDVWIRVDDDQGNRLEAGTFHSGDAITLQHDGPLHLIIGRTQNVEIDYAGEPVDLSAYKAGSVARLVLGQADE